MDLASILRTLGGLATVLGMLSAALWLVRRYDIRLPGRTGMARASRLELVERLPIDARRSVALLRRDGREHLILIAPEGHVILESAVVRDAADFAAVAPVAEAAPEVPQFRAELAAVGQGFGTLVERARDRAVPLGDLFRRGIAHLVALARRIRAVPFGALARSRIAGLAVIASRARARIRAQAPIILRRPSMQRLLVRARDCAGEASRLLEALAAPRTLVPSVSGGQPQPQRQHIAPDTAARARARPRVRPDAAGFPPLLKLMFERAATLTAPAPATPAAPPTPPPRSKPQRPPTRKPARKARAARKGLRHG